MALSRNEVIAALEEGGLLFRLCEAARLLVVVLDAEGRVLHVNAAAAELLGRPAEALVGRDWIDTCVPERLRGPVRETFRKVRDAAGGESYENPLLTASGEERLVAWTNAPLGRGRGTVSLGVDLGATRGLVGPGAAFAQTLMAAVENMVEGMITISQDGRILWANHAVEAIFGYPVKELVGQNVSVLMPEPDRSRHDGYIARYLRTGERRIIGIGRDVTGRRRDGSTFPVGLAVSEVRVGGKRLFTGIIRDLSDRKRAEEALAESEARLAAIQQQHTELERVAVAGEMAAIVAHEVRTPLNALSINLQLAERHVRREGPEARERALDLLGKLKGEVLRINALLEDYLRVARRPPERGSERIDVDAVVSDAATFLKPQAERAGVRMNLRLSGGARVRGQTAKLRQVVLNLALNAIQAMAEQGGGTLFIEVARDEGHVLLRVRDTGPGISDEQAARIFRPFVTTKAHGTGLGLSICDRVVRQMGGRIALVSAPGEGACFEVTLPALSGPEGDEP